MLKFVPIRFVFVLLSIGWLLGWYTNRLPFWPIFLLLFVFSAIVACGSYQIQWNFYFDSINQLPTKDSIVALTFDDGPVAGKTEEILAILKKHNVLATFFFIGNRVAKYPELAQKVANEGHLIGNHSHNHTFWFDLYREKRMAAELESCNLTIEKAIGKKPKLFRPPYGVTNPTMQRVLTKNGMVSVGWTVRSMDTVIKEKSKLQQNLSQTKPGDIVLLHDHGYQTAAVLDDYLTEIRKRNILVKRLDEIIGVSYE